jgi:hypothetical protein
MSRKLHLCLSLSVVCAVACSKSGSDTANTHPAASASSSPAKSGSLFSSGGGGACAKYLTPDVIARILNAPVRAPKVLSANSCTVERLDDAGSITITLFTTSTESFQASLKNLVDPTPLAGVGDEAVQSLIGISAVKKPNMWCDIDAGGAQGSTKGSRSTIGKELGDLCNKMFADGP